MIWPCEQSDWGCIDDPFGLPCPDTSKRCPAALLVTCCQGRITRRPWRLDQEQTDWFGAVGQTVDIASARLPTSCTLRPPGRQTARTLRVVVNCIRPIGRFVCLLVSLRGVLMGFPHQIGHGGTATSARIDPFLPRGLGQRLEGFMSANCRTVSLCLQSGRMRTCQPMLVSVPASTSVRPSAETYARSLGPGCIFADLPLMLGLSFRGTFNTLDEILTRRQLEASAPDPLRILRAFEPRQEPVCSFPVPHAESILVAVAVEVGTQPP
ncbi:unnamed protein product [Protopolystoma xenopodis]|uniref:Uncharacterized protein n=1 Tax=Protopolystoma xenopodis TaxID=117903 RepID=A0A3S5A2R3_9PLAT|nr:unnamed protein product [Protopolystoma xenopodis]